MTRTSTIPIQAEIDWERSRPGDGGDVLICAINLDRSPERWEAIREQLDASGLPYVRLRAVDGRALDPTLEAKVSHERFEQSNGRKITPGDIGCYLSHTAAWSFMATQATSKLLIVEDDAVFQPDWTQRLHSVLRAYKPGMLMKLSWQRPGLTRDVAPIDDTYRLVRPLTHQACCAAYLVDKTAAQHLLDHAFPIYVPVDHYMESPWETGVPVRSMMPRLVHQRGVASTISKQKKFHWSQRVPTLLYRIKAHSRRFLHGFLRTA
ncbi:glycosyltransferase family 25 protein [Tianweitania sp. BSSL-BM11]|uniref:Glycosyltransferase family 25 protein n=1 Tax=Tianweitania aestuarii TaxID=2814886 RepID=A0ABS5RYI3_9HYPH|nr:glycosyltransferase family 25 protein [Tianweitania aestuarii]MBS9720732.1 glycosyltransferase family 25 protein [Tianweitania aestuarii]